MNTTTVSYTICLCITILFTLPIAVYSGFQLYLHWNKQFIFKRRRMLILFIFILICYSSFIEYPFYIFVYWNELDTTISSFYTTIYVLSFFLRCCFPGLYVLRVYLLYFDHEYNRIISTKKWVILIDPSIKSNYFLVNRHHKYGDHRFLTLYFILPFITLYFIIFCCVYYLNFIPKDHIIALLFTTFFIICMTVIGIFYWRKYPKDSDIWFIRKEFTLTIKITALFPFVCIIAFFLLLFVTKHVIVYFLMTLEIIYGLVIYVMIIYPQKKIKNLSKNTLIEYVSSDIKWEDIIAAPEGFDEFGNFLQRELSAENILFIIEYIQLKNAMMKIESIKHIIQNKLNLNYMLELPASAPTSSIASKFTDSCSVNNDNIDNIHNAVIIGISELYYKYIDSEKALLEINISSSIRNQLINALKAEKTQSTDTFIVSILPLMESAAQEIGFLMNDSLLRFKQSHIFQQLIQQRQLHSNK